MLSALALRFQVVDRVIDWSSAFEAFNLDGIMVLLVLVPIAATVFSYRRYQDAMSVRGELARLSLHDSLTGLPNRLYLNDWLSSELKSAKLTNLHVAVLFIDLDRFKHVNDTYGHEVGDELMCSVAARMRITLRPEDRIIRYGGDEFVTICPGIPNRKAAERLAARLVEALETPFTVGTDTMRISTSIGIAMTEARGTNADELVREADVAMYEAKAAGRGNYVFFDRSRHGLLTPMSAEDQLRDALENGQFRLYYQPVVSLADGSLHGVEALIRWQHPERGLVRPDEFIPVLEDTGLIVPVGTWVLEEACRQAALWRDEFPARPPVKVAINVSARQLGQVDFRDRVAAALAASGTAPDQICIEITEGALMYDVASAWAALRHAKAMGVELALDDFGTGYSSLSYVRRFSLDMLKVDQSFVEGLGVMQEDAAIVEHVIGLARALGMQTVAEGIERLDQLAELQRLGCDLAQGYLFSRPVSARDISALLEDGLSGASLLPGVRPLPPHVDPFSPRPASLEEDRHPVPAPARPEPAPATASAGGVLLPKTREFRRAGD